MDSSGGIEVVDTTELWRMADDLQKLKTCPKNGSSHYYIAKAMQLSVIRKDPESFGRCLRYFPPKAIEYLNHINNKVFQRKTQPKTRRCLSDQRAFLDWVERIHALLKKEGLLNSCSWMLFRPHAAADAAWNRLFVTAPLAAQRVRDRLDYVERKFEEFKNGGSDFNLFDALMVFAQTIQDIVLALRANDVLKATPPGKSYQPGTPEIDKATLAFAILFQEPKISPTELAKRIGVKRNTLYSRAQKWNHVRDTLKACDAKSRPRGSRSKDGEIEAEDEYREFHPTDDD